MQRDDNEKYGRRRARKKTTFITDEKSSEDSAPPKKESPNPAKVSRSVEKEIKAKPRPAEKKDNSQTQIFEPSAGKDQKNSPRTESVKTEEKTHAERGPAKGKPQRRYTSRQPVERRHDSGSRRNKPENADRTVKTKRITNKYSRTPKISIIIPAYNEEKSIPKLMEHIKDMLDGVDYAGEVIIVNDASSDKTPKVLSDCLRQYRFLRVANHSIRGGLTQALKTGFRIARGDIFVYLPADLQYLPNDIPKMVARIDKGEDFVCGWGQGKAHLLKNISSTLYRLFSRILFGVDVHDLSSMKVFKREVIHSFRFRRGWYLFMAIMAAYEDFSIGEVKVNLYPRQYGKAKFGFSSMITGLFDLFLLKSQYILLKNPMRIFGSLGILLGLATVASIVFGALKYFNSQDFTLLISVSLILGISSVVVFTLGIFAEMLTTLIENQRANYRNTPPRKPTYK